MVRVGAVPARLWHHVLLEGRLVAGECHRLPSIVGCRRRPLVRRNLLPGPRTAACHGKCTCARVLCLLPVLCWCKLSLLLASKHMLMFIVCRSGVSRSALLSFRRNSRNAYLPTLSLSSPKVSPSPTLSSRPSPHCLSPPRARCARHLRRALLSFGKS